MHISEAAVKRPVATFMVYLAAMLLGFYSFKKLSIDFLPDIDVPKLIVKTEYPGANAGDVEENVTRPIEAALSTLQDVHKISSVSRDGISFINVVFNWGVNMDMAFINVRSKLDRMQEGLPEFSERPAILRFDPSSSPIMTLVVTGDRIEHPKSSQDYQNALMELKEVASSVIKRRLEQIDGIAQTVVSGGLEREIKVLLNKNRCLAFKIDYPEIESALRQYNVSAPGGMIRDGYFQYPLRIQAEFQTVKEIYDTPVKRTENGQIIFLRDIARIEDGFKDRIGYTRLNGKEVITLYLYKEADANTVRASKEVYNTLAGLIKEYPEFRILPVFDQAEFIQDAIDDVLQSLYLGGILAFLVLVIFLKDLKSPILIGISIPISIVTTFIFMKLFKINFNIISLGGLALGIGQLLDNSIVVLENIFRYRKMGHSEYDAALLGTREVGKAITSSTFTNLAVFLPLIYLKGLAGELFYDQVMTISISLLVSLIVALTLVPMLTTQHIRVNSYMKDLLRGKSHPLLPIQNKGNRTIRRSLTILIRSIETIIFGMIFFLYKHIIKFVVRLVAFSIHRFQEFFERYSNGYIKVLSNALNRRKLVIGITAVFLGLSIILVFIVKSELMPPVDQKQLVISAELPAGSGLTATTSAVKNVEKMLQDFNGVKNVLSSIGISENLLDQSYQPGLNKAVFDLETFGRANSFKIGRSLESGFKNFPGMALSLRQRESDFEQLFQQNQDLFDVKISGPELEPLSAMNIRIMEFLKGKKCFSNVLTSQKKGVSEYVIRFDRDKLVQYGISSAAVTDFMKRWMQGSVPTQFVDFSDKIDIKVLNNEQGAMALQRLGAQLLPANISDQTVYLPIKDFYSVKSKESFSEIEHENQNSMIRLTATLQKMGYSSAKKKLESFLRKINIPAGYLVEIGSLKQEMRENFKNLSMILIIAIAIMYFILASEYESFRIPFIIMMTVPLALIGLVVTLFITGNSFNVMSFIGAIVLVGIVDNNAIIMLDFVHHRFLSGADMKSAIIEGASKRFRPIIMTTATAVLGLFPMVVATGRGAELRRPMAWAIMGGLTFATMLTLIVIPIIYSFIVKRKQNTHDKNV